MHNDVLIVNLLRVTIRTLPYFELEKIWDHFYYTNAPHLYSKSGLRFAVARCIATFLLRVTIRNILCFELEQIQDHFYYINFLFFYNKSGIRFDLAKSMAKFL